MRITRPWAALAISSVALFVALSGTGYALTLPKNSVASKQVTNGSLLAKDFKRGQLPPGPPGPEGATGPKGETGPSNAYLGTTPAGVTVPAGDYAVTGTVGADNSAGGSPSVLTCALSVTGAGSTKTAPEGSLRVLAGAKSMLPLSATVHLPSGGSISQQGCVLAGPGSFYGFTVTAIRVGTASP